MYTGLSASGPASECWAIFNRKSLQMYLVCRQKNDYFILLFGDFFPPPETPNPIRLVVIANTRISNINPRPATGNRVGTFVVPYSPRRFLVFNTISHCIPSCSGIILYYLFFFFPYRIFVRYIRGSAREWWKYITSLLRTWFPFGV